MPSPAPTQRERWRRIIFEADTPEGRRFDLLLIAAILLSVLAVMLASVEELHARWATVFVSVEWFFTLLFTVEYAARCGPCVRPCTTRGVFSGWSMCSPFCRPT